MPKTKSDDPKKKKQDAKLVSMQPHEQKYLQKKTGKSAAEVAKATKSAGPSKP
jgi:putative N-acetylmannosamine-6-phosphate epimerase